MPISKIQANSLAANAVASAPGKNLIINGAMQVWQRGTSQTTSGGYGADRFWMASATSASRNTDVPSGFVYSTKLTYSASVMSIGQPIELSATGNSSPMISGESVTLSFYAKVDSGTEAFTAGINFRDSKFSATNQASFTPIGGSGFTATTSWQRFTKTFTVPSVNGTNVIAGLEIGNIDKDFYITGVQLEVGGTATDFEHRSYGEELALCQRYYQILTLLNTSYSAAIAYTGGSNAILPNTNFSTMRAAPTVTFDSSGNIEYYSGSAWTDTTVSAQDTTDNYTVIVALSAGPSGVTRGSLIRADQGTPMNALLDAEL